MAGKWQCYTLQSARELLSILQYTLILRASKELPKQCVDLATGKSRTRRSVGVRMPRHAITQAIADHLVQLALNHQCMSALCLGLLVLYHMVKVAKTVSMSHGSCVPRQSSPSIWLT